MNTQFWLIYLNCTNLLKRLNKLQSFLPLLKHFNLYIHLQNIFFNIKRKICHLSTMTVMSSFSLAPLFLFGPTWSSSASLAAFITSESSLKSDKSCRDDRFVGSTRRCSNSPAFKSWSSTHQLIFMFRQHSVHLQVKPERKMTYFKRLPKVVPLCSFPFDTLSNLADSGSIPSSLLPEKQN